MNTPAYSIKTQPPAEPIITKTHVENRSFFRPVNVLCLCLVAISLSLLCNYPAPSDAMDAPAFVEAVKAFPNHFLGKEVTVSGKVVSSAATKVGSGSAGYSIALDAIGGINVLVVFRPESPVGLSDRQAKFLNELRNGQRIKVRGTLLRTEQGKNGSMVCVIEEGEVFG